MAFSPFTQPVKPAEWVDPLDLNIYAKGMMYKQEMAEKNLKSIVDTYKSITSIPAYGADATQLAKIDQEMKAKLSSMNFSNLNDIGTLSQVKSVINQYTSDPHVLAIAKRGNIYERELKRKQEAEDKGEGFTSPALETLEKYYNQGNFYEKPQGVNLSTGWVSPPVQKWMKDAREAVKKQVLNTKTGELNEVVDAKEARDYFMQLSASDPRFQKQLFWDFNKKTEGLDWETEGQNYIAEKIEERRAELIQAKLSKDFEKESLVTNELQRLQKMANPSLIGEELQKQYFNSWLEDEMDKVGYSMDQTSFKDYKRDPVYMENLRTSNNIREAKIKAYYDAGYDPNTGLPLVTKDGKSLVETKQQKEYKPTEKQTIGKRLLQSKTITNSDIQTLLEKGEYGNLKRDTNGNFIVEYYEEKPMIDPETKQVVYTKTPVRKEPLNEFLQARTNLIEFKHVRYNSTSTPVSTPAAQPDEFDEYKRKN